MALSVCRRLQSVEQAFTVAMIAPGDKLTERTMVETQRIVDWLQRLVRIPSVGPRNAGCAPGRLTKVESPRSWRPGLMRSAVKSSVADVYPGGPNTYGVWCGQSGRCIAVDVHVDTVGIETKIGDPFDGRLENGRVYGRGSVDAKASLGVVLALLEDMQQRVNPNLVVCASSDEETGCGDASVFSQWVHRSR
jgi:acetylornithine deacetylase/succinyl-diaminopimelate desuccinylase-like protein